MSAIPRDEWCSESMGGHEQGLCDCQAIQAFKQSVRDTEAMLRQRVTELEQQLAHYTYACASVGETDGHGWAETTIELRRQLAAVTQDNAMLRERLEIGFAYDRDGKRVSLPEEKAGQAFDGIFCRDETIRLQDEAVAQLKSRLQVAESTLKDLSEARQPATPRTKDEKEDGYANPK